MFKLTLSVIAILMALLTTAQINYGNNPSAGNYFNVGDARLYYEVYGKGKPVVMLHGGIYGYIDEFEQIISKLSQHFQVICIATRGHGKSEIGREPFSYKQRAEDAYKVIRHVTKDSVHVLGFSDGGYTGLKLAAEHPELVQSLIAMGVGDNPANGHRQKANYSPAELLKSDSAFFVSRLALMPEPTRWKEMLDKSNQLYNNDFVSKETFSRIKCPTLYMSGDKDQYHPASATVAAFQSTKDAKLSIIAGCGHVIFFCNFKAVWNQMAPFLSLPADK